MAQRRWLRCNPEAAQERGSFGDPSNRLDHVVNMALRVRSTRDRKPNEIHRGRRLRAVRLPAEHHRPDLAAADATFDVEGHGECLAGVFERRDVGQHRAGIDVHSVSADRQYHWNTGTVEHFTEVSRGPNPIAEVVLVDDLPETLRD